MLPRAALRTINSPSLRSHGRLHGSFTAGLSALRSRTYASGSKPPRNQPAPSTPRGAKPPPAQAYPGASSRVRQTSPNADASKDQTWKAKDGIKFGAASAAGSQVTSKPPVSPVEGVRPKDQSAANESVLEGKPRPQEPIAQQTDHDEPVPGSIRDEAHAKIAESENTPPPPEAPSKPLPDLRQGIPSTFDIEFGAEKMKQSAGRKSQGEKADLTSESAEDARQNERGERDYDRSAYETSLDRRRARVLNYFYASALFLSLTTAFYIARPYSVSEELPSGLEPEDASGWSLGKMYARMRARWGHQVAHYTEPAFPQLLPEMPEDQRAPFTLVLSLEDLLIHTTWDTKHGYRIAKRPGVDYFLKYLSQYYELVCFTNTNMAFADPVLRKLDPYHIMMFSLGREATKYEKGEYIKDLSYLNRPLSKTLIIETHAPSVKNQPENAIILPQWEGDAKDPHAKDLIALIPFLEHVATMGVEDVRDVLKSFEGKPIAEEFARREALARKRFLEQRETEQKRRPGFSLGSLAGALGVKSGGAGGGMVLADGQTVAEGYAQGKMLSDQIREQGQRQYEAIEKHFRENGEEFLKQEEEENKRMMEAYSKDMRQGALSWFGGSGGDNKKD